MKAIKIDKNIPIPDPKFGPIGSRIGCMYPFKKMNVGDSFFVKTKGPLQSRKKLQSIKSASKSWCKNNHVTNRKFTVRMLKNGVRIWRTK